MVPPRNKDPTLNYGQLRKMVDGVKKRTKRVEEKSDKQEAAKPKKATTNEEAPLNQQTTDPVSERTSSPSVDFHESIFKISYPRTTDSGTRQSDC
jgi:hypothetical protein